MTTEPGATLLLVRHAESEWNALGRWQGHADPPLSELGRLQARHAAARAADHGTFDRLVASDLDRAVQTARIIAERLDLPVHLEADLRERSAGEWQGFTRVEIEERWPGFLEGGRRPPGFETDEHLLRRVEPAMERLAVRHRGERLLVVTHGGVLRAMERRHGIEGERIPNLGGRFWHWTVAGFAPGEPVVLVEADEITRPVET